jgi:predicted metal-binding transcription factor (methanogenesis marker protein 9)
MSSNSEYAQGLVLINGHAYPVKEVLQALERQAMTSLRIVGNELWVGKERVRPLPKTTPEQAMKLTCYGSLAYCCDLNRECHLRDQALKLLGISKEEYRAIQIECHQQFIRHAERRWPQEQTRSATSDVSRSSSYSRSRSQDPWHDLESAESSAQSRSYAQSAKPSSSSSVDLGGLFSTPEEYQSRSFFDSDPASSFTSRLAHGSSSPSSDGWIASSPSAMGAPSTPAHGFCIYCGQDLREDSDFCSRCGRSQK